MRYVCVTFLSFFVFAASGDTAGELNRARAAATRKQLQMFSDAIEGYLTDFDAPPPDFPSLVKALQGTYLREVPRNDAWGTPFHYDVDGKTYRVVSAGSDRKFDPSTWTKIAVTDDTSADALVSNRCFAGSQGMVARTGSIDCSRWQTVSSV